ncbi:hypothetical protein [Leifsonia sp. 21MFCrub1.1]|uniref:hypothetical protein n=1 Tax=Leifsonia sp. 21MFCrub1.1 TaxID=1798223 RepID=UPI00089282B6|nr:hypothetical protein [Leifsonia sp. 21MFCrub1.1]SEA45724.1 hypothetical protein SAMN04515680_0411 [Leifsonia sp. 21MFCrub1.1]
MARYRRVVVAVLVVTLATGVTAGLGGCSVFRGVVNQQLTTEENLANQKKVALQTMRDYPNPALESIRFTSEGHVDGGGDWSANATVTIDGKDYREILGILTSVGEVFPKPSPGSTPGAVTVIYSDDTSEVLK